MKQGAGEETEELALLVQAEDPQRDFQNELSNCTLASLVLVHFKHFKASSCWGQWFGLQKMQ